LNGWKCLLFREPWQLCWLRCCQAYTDQADELRQAYLKELEEVGSKTKAKTSSAHRPKQQHKVKTSAVSDDSDSNQSSGSDRGSPEAKQVIYLFICFSQHYM
jgi:hypothetical protein